MLTDLGAELQPPASLAIINRVAGQLGVTIPPDARRLYEQTNGTNGEFGCMWNFRPIESAELALSHYLKSPRGFVIAPDERTRNPAKYLIFCDALIEAPLYAYCADERSPFFGEVIGCHLAAGGVDAFLSAPSVSRFLEMLAATRGEDAILADGEVSTARPEALAKTALRPLGPWLVGVLFIIAGAFHFIDPVPYLAMMPPWLPAPGLLVIVSGLAEIAGGIGVLIPPLRRAAAWGLIALLVAVFPANLQVALHGWPGVDIAPWVLWARLPFQLLFIWAVHRACLARPKP